VHLHVHVLFNVGILVQKVGNVNRLVTRLFK